MKHTVKLLLTLFFILVVSGSCGLRTSRLLRGVNALMDSLKTVHLEDTRTTYWQLNLHGDNDRYSVEGELVSREAWLALDHALEQQFPDVENHVHLLTDEAMTPLVNGLVNNSVIHLRAAPSSKTEMVTQALMGSPVRILTEREGKILIQIPSGYLGWVNIPEVAPLDTEQLLRYREADKLIVTAQYGTVYSEPDERSLAVSDVVVGCILEHVSENREFQQVRYPDGRIGWIRKEICVPAAEIFFKTPTREGLVQTALEFHGIPYLWGGTSSKAIDCSGLITNIYFMNGIQLPRDADQQTHVGREVSTNYTSEGLEPGDLLFFGRKATEEKEESVTHVAMYMGEGEFIHSAGYKERVSINSLDPLQENFIESYPDIFIRTVRILGEENGGWWPIPDNPMYHAIIDTDQ
jgi:hypothetical protein